MAGVNKVILIGNLGQDPEVKFMPSGDAVANVSIATSETWKDKNTGEKQERTEWHRVVFFGKLAEIVQQYLKKGSKVYVEGKLRTRSWEQEGVKRYSTEIVVDMTGTMQMLDSRQDGDQRPAQQPQQSASKRMDPQNRASMGAQAPSGDNWDDSGDIPF